MTKSANTEGIEKATGTKWDEWVAFLDSINAKDLAHKEIAEKVYTKLKGQHESAGWWSQSIAVAYEQHIGRRQPGQRPDGTFEVAVSKTFTGSIDDAMQTWLRLFDNRTEFSGVAIIKAPTSSKTNKNSHWGCGLDDGSRVNVDATTYGKPEGKATLTITHIRLQSAEAVKKWRTYWKEFLSKLSN